MSHTTPSDSVCLLWWMVVIKLSWNYILRKIIAQREVFWTWWWSWMVGGNKVATRFGDLHCCPYCCLLAAPQARTQHGCCSLRHLSRYWMTMGTLLNNVVYLFLYAVVPLLLLLLLSCLWTYGRRCGSGDFTRNAFTERWAKINQIHPPWSQSFVK